MGSGEENAAAFSDSAFSATRGADILTVFRRGRRPRRSVGLQKPHGFTCRMVENTSCFQIRLFLDTLKLKIQFCATRAEHTSFSHFEKVQNCLCRYARTADKESFRGLLVNLHDLGGRSLRSIPPKNPFVFKASATMKKI